MKFANKQQTETTLAPLTTLLRAVKIHVIGNKVIKTLYQCNFLVNKVDEIM